VISFVVYDRWSGYRNIDCQNSPFENALIFAGTHAVDTV
jgi:hypothetical protein